MFNGLPSPIMLITGKTAKEIYEKSKITMDDHTQEIKEARKRLRKTKGLDQLHFSSTIFVLWLNILFPRRL